MEANGDEAIGFFQINIDSFPKSNKVYDSMGEAWMNKGDFKKSDRLLLKIIGAES